MSGGGRGGAVNGAGEGEEAGAIAPVSNLHSTTISAGMASPVELCMKSMGVIRQASDLAPVLSCYAGFA